MRVVYKLSHDVVWRPGCSATHCLASKHCHPGDQYATIWQWYLIEALLAVYPFLLLKIIQDWWYERSHFFAGTRMVIFLLVPFR